MVSDDRPVRKKRRKVGGYYVLILVLVVAVGGFWLFRWRQKAKLERKMDAIRAAGYPVTCAELDDWYGIPDGVANAADVILDAISYYHEPNRPDLVPVGGRAKLPERGEALSDETAQAIADYLAANEQALELVGEAAGIEHSRYPIDLSAGFETSMPYLRGVRDMARLLKIDAVMHAEANEAGQAVESVASIFGVARSLSGEPVIVPQLVRVGCQGNGLSAIERIVNRAELDDMHLGELSRFIAGAENNSGFVRAAAGERCCILEILRDPGKMDPRVFGSPRIMGVLLSGYKAAGLTHKGAILYLDFAEELLQANKLAEHKRLAAVAALEAKLEKASGIQAMMVRLLVPAHGRAVALDLRISARLRAARAGLAIERYRLAGGKLPETLGELVPTYLDAVPKDPFDGQELRFRRLEKGYVVYSVGEDGNDDGGQELNEQNKDNWDVTFIVER